MFSSVALIILYGVFTLGKGQLMESECFSDVTSLSTSKGNNINLLCKPMKVLHIFCATVPRNGVFQDSIDKTEILRSRCFLKSNCTIANTPVSLNVVYNCKTLFHIKKKETANLTIACDNDSLVEVHSATYSNKFASKCDQIDKTSVVRTRCQGLPNCTFQVKNHNLQGDPCPGAKKSLEVRYGCYKDCSVDFKSDKCSKSCNKNCKQRSCFIQNGVCNLGCEVGFHGDTCEKQCPSKTYGHSCSQQCSEFCGGLHQACDHVNGSCFDACHAGYMGSKCDLKCPSNTYGENCSQQCSKFCGGQECHHVNGTCFGSCRGGYTGPICDSKLDVGNKEHYSSSAIFASILFVLVVLTICLIPKEIKPGTRTSMEVFEDRGLGAPIPSKLDLEPGWSNFDNIDPLPEIDEPPEQL